MSHRKSGKIPGKSTRDHPTGASWRIFQEEFPVFVAGHTRSLKYAMWHSVMWKNPHYSTICALLFSKLGMAIYKDVASFLDHWVNKCISINLATLENWHFFKTFDEWSMSMRFNGFVFIYNYMCSYHEKWEWLTCLFALGQARLQWPTWPDLKAHVSTKKHVCRQRAATKKKLWTCLVSWEFVWEGYGWVNN